MHSNRATLVIIAGTALPLSASVNNPVMVPAMPEQIEDSCSLYALADSTALVDTYKAIQITDLDGDGSVTDADFAEWIKTNIAPNLVINDVDGDGYLTAEDEVAALAVVLDKLSGDLNADGTVSFDDTALFLDLFVNPPASATGLSDQSANVALSGFFWPPNHYGAINHSWTDASHVITVSQQRPATHHEFVSRRWQPNDDGEHPRWPPNHDVSVSHPREGPADPAPPPARPWWLPNLFPPGHDVSTTVQQRLPFYP